MESVKVKPEQEEPRLGTVIAGTMRPEDLLPAFADTLWTYDSSSASALTAVWERDGWPMSHNDLDLSEEAIEEHKDDSIELLVDFFDALNDIAPDGAYFGSHPGDGSDYGFWEAEED